MTSLVRLLPLLFVAMPAFAGVPETYTQWKYLRDPSTGPASFEEGYRFLTQHKGWPQENVLRLRTEQAALYEQPDKATMQKFCTAYPPISGRGMLACAQAGIGDEATRAAWVRKAWLQGDFGAAEETNILNTYRFTREQHEARIDRLLYEGKLDQARRLLPKMTPAYRLLCEARIALITNAKNASAKVYSVPKALQNHTGLAYHRMQWRARNGQEDGARELLLNGPANPPYADLWWPRRAQTVREAVEDGRYSQAIRLLKHAGELNPENNADALFLKGWITMEFLGDPRTGYKDFYALYNAVQTPVSKARAAYWAGRAARKNGNTDIARDWFAKGAEFPTVFYGQLAAAQLNRNAPLPLPADPAAGKVANEAIAQTAMWLFGQGDLPMSTLFLTTLAEQSNPAQAQALAKRAAANKNLHGAVKVAKQAIRQNTILLNAGWPIVPVPKQSPIEPALALAIARQESEFNPKARSHADARGLMQVLPGTANHTAKRHNLPYNARHLYEPQPNMVIGSTYLGGLVDGWDGSYILAIASYNAGPANVRKWVARFGNPPRDLEGAVNWLEKIPFAETRNYVQRVLENVQVYRARMHPERPLGIEKDIVRGR